MGCSHCLILYGGCACVALQNVRCNVKGQSTHANSGSARVQITLYRATCTSDITSQDFVCRLKPSSMLHGSVFCIQPCAAVGLHRVNYFNSWLSRLTTPALFNLNLTPSETPSFSLSPSPLYMPGLRVRVARRQPNDMMHLQGPTARYRY